MDVSDDLRRIQTILNKIHKNVLEEKWPCMCHDCHDTAVDCHLLMRNGILNFVTENGRLVALRAKKPAAFKQEELPFSFKLVGNREAVSLPIFCNTHDTSLFKEIEDGSFDFQNIRHLLLYSYRTLCSEIRRKEIIVEQLKRELNSNILSELLPIEIIYAKKISIAGLLKGIEDMNYYRNQMETNLQTLSDDFVFLSKPLPLKGIYVSSVSTLFYDEQDSLSEKELNIFIFHLIPQNNYTQLVLGYHKKHVNDRIKKYIKRWESASSKEYGYMLTGLLSQLESWGMRPSIFKQIPKARINKFYAVIASNFNTIRQYPDESLDLFDGIINT
ncbi:MAG: hypothetical protein IK004_01100 [Bacteroidales bacterium]|nr:hypothetical protein [Bacteroidales bacterium]